MEKVRIIQRNDSSWNLYDYIMFFHDQAGNFEHCVSEEVLSYLQRAAPHLNVTLDECSGYLNAIYGKAASLEAT